MTKANGSMGKQADGGQINADGQTDKQTINNGWTDGWLEMHLQRNVCDDPLNRGGTLPATQTTELVVKEPVT